MILFAGVVILMASCSEDEGPIIEVVEGVNVGDGFYITIAGQDPTADAILVDEIVSASDGGTQKRAGLVAKHLFLTSGNYQIVKIVNKQVTETWGGTAESIEDGGSGCDLNTYTLIGGTLDGAAFNIPANGVYKISYDAGSSEIIVFSIQNAGIIGSATPDAWNSDQILSIDGTPSASSITFKGTDILMRSGAYKVRFNCRWSIDRRIDPAAGYDFSNRYEMFTNFGGTLGALVSGGSNFALDVMNEGIYTVSITIDENGPAVNLEKTADAPVITFAPEDFRWGVIGDATAKAWDADRDMNYSGLNEGTHTWTGVVTFSSTGEFRFRTNDDWALNIGGDLTSDGSEANLVADGSNSPTPGEGAHYITLKTADEGTTWAAAMVANGWGVIGEGSPQGNWDADIDMTANGFDTDTGITTYGISGDFTTAGWKFRAGDAWDFNLGGDIAALSHNGDNLAVAADGTYAVVLSFDGTTRDKQWHRQQLIPKVHNGYIRCEYFLLSND